MQPKDYIRQNMPFLMFEKPSDIEGYEKFLQDTYLKNLFILYNRISKTWELWHFVDEHGIPYKGFDFKFPDGQRFIPGRDGKGFVRNKLDRCYWRNMTKSQLYGEMRSAKYEQERRHERALQDVRELEWENRHYDEGDPRSYVPRNYGE
jgi:hypothetical protein